MGAFAIGIDHPKRELNVGTLLRSAFNFGAALVFTVGRRYEPQHGDTVKAWRQLPVMHFQTWDDYRMSAPRAWVPVGVEIGREAVDLRTYRHPPCAVYILGAEDGGLTNEAAALCHDLVVIPSTLCLNVAVAGAVVMYDRLAKKTRK